MTSEQRRICVGRINTTYYQSSSPLTGDVVLLLHGWGISGKTWLPLFEHIGDKYHTLAPDLPNFGDSDETPGPWGYEDYAHFVAEFLAQQGDSVQAHVIGHSMGGGIAAAFAALYPDVVKSLVLISPAGVPLSKVQHVAFTRIAEVSVQLAQSGFRFNQFSFLNTFLDNVIKRPNNMLQTMQFPASEDVRPLLPSVKAPCTVLWGKDDKLLPVTLAPDFQAGIPHATLQVIEGAGHEWCLIYPEQLAQVLNVSIRA